MQTLYRRLLDLMPRIGVQVTDLGPGSAVVSRRGGPYKATGVDKDTWLLRRTRNGARAEIAKGSVVPLGDTGARLLLEDPAEQDERKLQLAAAEYLCVQHVTAMLELYGVNCVFDVGANTGQYAKRLRRAGYTGRIVSFEPTSETFARLEKAAAKDPEWHVHQCGLGREDTTAEIHTGWKTMNSLLSASDYGRDRYSRFAKSDTEEIRIRRLDEAMDEALKGLDDPRPYLKMDTQGYDLEVFAGAGERVAEFVGMQSEVAVLRLYEGSPGMGEAVAAYEAAGFGITGMYPVTREATTGRVIEFDCVLMRADAAPTP
ncbi:FkbM family methyltransferase [Streptomyces sp. NBC_01275]|uniref:FkbM family methyltransferase n=1 Tax=Streptomyces sp. NBC_01275 TaxID=2903807 RepID=UPI00224EF336|nr:FkbM family methyltransferase [Streptomyces sp. NBC_01275]MCX4766902.1 FkbM family methyltransferase [Streptomyces sp. NBC_01275]